jgi:hypothetical protein
MKQEVPFLPEKKGHHLVFMYHCPTLPKMLHTCHNLGIFTTLVRELWSKEGEHEAARGTIPIGKSGYDTL